MATEKFSAAAAQATVLTTQLNSLANGAYSALGALLDNTINLDRFAVAELALDTASATDAASMVDLFAVVAPDGTNYGDVTIPSGFYYCGSFQLQATAAAQLVQTPVFELPGPFKTKFLVYNRSGQAFPSSGTTVKVSTFNRTIG